MTTLSPYSVGRVETRKSTSRPSVLILMRPSCGRRRSAIFSLAISLTREMMAAFSSRGGGSLTRQHAVDAVADAKLFLERLDVDVAGALLDGLRDHGVHQPDHGRLAGHVAEVFEILRFADGRRELGFVLGGLAVVAVDGVEDFLLQRDPGHRPPGRWTTSTALRVSKSSGSAMASVTVWSCRATGRQRNWRRNRGASVSSSGETAGGPSSVSTGTCNCSASADSTSRMAMKPRSTRILPSFSPPRSFWISSARARSSAGPTSPPIGEGVFQ